ncbi:HAMP domain-containing protein [Actinokineospora sp. NBRC 105648]|uniref:HAMP domain-containing protein n=1 Tax=Actinokineospora sp. NBRC 105648 TaxID=3032206 RepID=UPI0024A00DCB|nr:HAMP domain-containing protein [Actinokineospora sp. NBRC 105648]GLZ41843.1 hypothetical protein Acsp05_54670 [Actinokineospora sp. NBRC 105648]
MRARSGGAAKLAEQVPEGGFLGSVRAPATVVAALFLILAALTVILLEPHGESRLPAAFRDSQQQFAVSAARSIGVSATRGLGDLRVLAANSSAAKPDELLDLVMDNRKWRGAAVVDRSTRALLATRGEQVPAQALPTDLTRDVLTRISEPNSELGLLVGTPLPDGRVLVATATLRLPDPGPDGGLDQSLFLTTAAGEVIATAHASPDAAAMAPRVTPLVVEAARAAPGGAGLLLAPVADDAQQVVAYAPAASATDGPQLDLGVVAVASGRVDGPTAGRSGWLPAAVLAVLAALGLLATRWALTSPVHALRDDALRVAGGEVEHRVRTPRTAETARVAAGIEHCRAKVAGTAARRMRRARVSALVVVLLTCVSTVLWAVLVVLASRGDDTVVPETVVSSLRNQTGRAADTLRRSMNDGLADLETVARASGANDKALATALDRMSQDQVRYRSLYVVERDGEPSMQVGRSPLRLRERPPTSSGIRQQNSAGRVPVLFAHVPLPDGKRTLIGEFDLDHIGRVLDQAPGHVRLLDDDLRTIGANEGYLAFEQATEDGVRAGVDTARRGDPTAAVTGAPGGQSLVASAAVTGGEIGRLRWTVVSRSPVEEIALAQNEHRQRTLLVALLALLITGFGAGWHYFGVVRPLRRLAVSADAVVEGDLDSVIYPQRHDAVGTLAFCLEICRQAATQGAGRLGEVRRPRGSAMDETQYIRPIVDRAPEPAPRKPGPGRARSKGAGKDRPKSRIEQRT